MMNNHDVCVCVCVMQRAFLLILQFGIVCRFFSVFSHSFATRIVWQRHQPRRSVSLHLASQNVYIITYSKYQFFHYLEAIMYSNRRCTLLYIQSNATVVSDGTVNNNIQRIYYTCMHRHTIYMCCVCVCSVTTYIFYGSRTHIAFTCTHARTQTSLIHILTMHGQRVMWAQHTAYFRYESKRIETMPCCTALAAHLFGWTIYKLFAVNAARRRRHHRCRHRHNKSAKLGGYLVVDTIPQNNN